MSRSRRHTRQGARVEATRGHRTGIHDRYAIVTDAMQTSLARRQRRRRNGGRRPSTRQARRRRRRDRHPALPLRLVPRRRPRRLRRGGERLLATTARACPTPRRSSRTSSSTRRRGSTTGPARSCWPRFARERRDVVTFDEIAAGRHRRDDLHRGQDVLGERRLRPGRHHRPPPSTPSRARPAVPRRSPSSWSATASCPSRPFTTDLRAQDPRDHPVDPPDPGLSRARRARSRSSPPT